MGKQGLEQEHEDLRRTREIEKEKELQKQYQKVEDKGETERIDEEKKKGKG